MSKRDLLFWVNSFFRLQYTKVEDAASGALYCQIMDCLCPGKVPMHKVNFQARQEVEMLNNFKILQQVFNSEGISKPIDMTKLVKGKFQDNFEFLQWMKGYFDSSYTGEPYDATTARQATSKSNGKSKSSSSASATALLSNSPYKRPLSPAVLLATEITGTSTATTPSTTTTATTKSATAAFASIPASAAATKVSTLSPIVKLSVSSCRQDQLLQEHFMEGESAKFRIRISSLLKERNFYYNKLRVVEIATKEYKDDGSSSVERQANVELIRILSAQGDCGDLFLPPSKHERLNELEMNLVEDQDRPGNVSERRKDYIPTNVDARARASVPSLPESLITQAAEESHLREQSSSSSSSSFTSSATPESPTEWNPTLSGELSITSIFVHQRQSSTGSDIFDPTAET